MILTFLCHLAQAAPSGEDKPKAKKHRRRHRSKAKKAAEAQTTQQDNG